MKQTTVSILMGAYNAERYIVDSIESVLQSNYKDWELIIVDDYSTDNTFEILQHYALIDTRIRIFKNEKNLGDYPNRNKTASYAVGKYLKYLDSDDVIYKYSLDYMVEAMEKHPDAALAIGFNEIDDVSPYPIYNTPKETYQAQFLGKGFLSYGPSASIIRKNIFDDIGGFLEQNFIGDQELWLRIALTHPIIKLQPSLVWYRVHSNQQTNNERKNIFVNDIRFKITLQSLKNAESLLSTQDYKYAETKIKQHYARTILRHILKHKKLKEGFSLYKRSQLNIVELLSGFKPFIK